MVKPLEHIRILDLTNVLAGPFCCHQLVHLGAEVIKVEVPERGDLARQLGADLELNERLMGTSFWHRMRVSVRSPSISSMRRVECFSGSS